MFKYYEEPAPYGKGDNQYTRYHVVGNPLRSSDPQQELPMGHIILQHRQFIPNFDGNAGHKVSEEYKEHTEIEAQRRDQDPYEHSNELPDPKTLFSETPPMVHGAYAHSSIRHAMPTLLAHAYNKHGRLQADYSLSAHSAPLVQRGIAAGLAESHPYNPTAEASNKIDFTDWRYLTNPDAVKNDLRNKTFREIPKEDIYRAQQVVRRMLRPQKRNTKAMGGPQFYQAEAEQPQQLPAMEGM